VSAIGRKKQTWRLQDFESKTDNGRWTRVAGDMLESKAWQQLTVYEIAVYLHMKNKFRVKNTGEHNGRDISFTYNEAVTKLKMGRARFTKAIDTLLAVGLIDMVEHNPHSPQATIYGFSSRWQLYGTDNFKTQNRVRRRQYTDK